MDVADAPVWAATPGQRALVWTIRKPGDWKALRSVNGVNAELVTVALLDEPSACSYAEALRSGASAAVAWEEEPEKIAQTLRAAVDGFALIPCGVAQALAAQVPAGEDADWIAAEEMGWLRTLSSGATVHTLAEQAGYSERVLYRRLRGLYERLGVANRTEALLLAARRGLLG